MNWRRLLLFLLVIAPLCAQYAVIKDPIVDMGTSFPSPDNPPATQCRRAHQGLYNEQVNCIQECDEHMEVACENLIYGIEPITHKPRNNFWLYKKHLAFFDQLDKDLAHALPNPTYGQEPTIVLIYPWQQFSLGTRFRHVPENDSATAYAILRINYETGVVIQDYVPHENAIREIKKSPEQARMLFVELVNNLVDHVAHDNDDKVIAYIWGGSSFTELYAREDFYQEKGAWHRNGKRNPYCGYDCSEFVMRMAQIAGVDFPWKVSLIMQESLKMLDNNDVLENGDIIWTSGHVMIISNIGHNEIIESRGYGSGYGCIHRLKLGECFQDTATYADLLNHYYAKEPITYLDKQGMPSGNPQFFKILKLTCPV